jgi:glycosyltransferase domain-containing protein
MLPDFPADHQELILAEPLITVGIPTYNRHQSLRRTLECITGQTYQNLEIIVSDNCSDGQDTETLVREFMKKDRRIQYFRWDSHQGPYINFNFILGKSTSEYFMWAADDDEWEPQFISRLLVFLLQNPDVSVVMSGVTRIFDNGRKRDVTRFREQSRSNYNQFRLAFFAAGHTEITFYIYGLYRTNILKKFSANLDNSFAKDVIVICEMVLSVKFGYVDELLHIQHIHSKNTSERYSGEEIGKTYGDPLNYLKLFVGFGSHMLRSSNIPVKHKLWIPFIMIRLGIWIGWNYMYLIKQIIIVKHI